MPSNRSSRRTTRALPVARLTTAAPAALPLGAMLLAGSLQAVAQTTPASAIATLPTVEVRDEVEVPQTKNELRTRNSGIAKGNQELRDIPQSVTVMTERLIDDRNLDDFREVLKTTAGVTFQAGETGEEDIRLRGFSLVQSGDIYNDGLRDGALYERDTFNNDRVEVLKGSASMLFGKGSTGGVVNQVSKQPFLMDQHEVTYTLGSGRENRLTSDFNFKTGEDSAFRLNAMLHDAHNNGAEVSKKGIAPTYRWGIGSRDEFSVGLYHLESNSVPNYSNPWFLSEGTRGQIIPTLAAGNYYGLASDYLDTQATYATFTHKHRFDQNSSLTTRVRHGTYERDLWASVIQFRPAANQPGGVAASATNLSANTALQRTPKGRVGISDLTQIQSDYVGSFEALGKKHDLIAGVDIYMEDAKRNNSFAGATSGLYTTIGTPNDGDFRADTRGAPAFNTFEASNLGLYAQDTVALTSSLKLIGGLRFDRFRTSYLTSAGVAHHIAANLWSPRVGALYQPNEETSYYVSFGTSYNTSGDTYQFTPQAPSTKDANTPPEKSRNFEIGSKLELWEKKASLGVAFFYSEKYNERNTDPDTAATQQLLSGKRHATGMEFNLAGRITPAWEVFYNHTWIPSAKIDKSNVALNAQGTGAQVQGDRPGLTPKHSASLWTTYKVTPKWRVGAGLNYRGQQSPEGARHVVAKAFTTVDAMAEYAYDDTTTVKLNVTNLTNELYADSLYRGFYAPGAPRAVQLTLKKLF